MVICGSGPNLLPELKALWAALVFPVQILSIVVPIRVVAFLHLRHRCLTFLVCIGHAAAVSAGTL